MDSIESNRHEVMTDGKTVWVNGPDGCCVARFSSTGSEIHYPSVIQITTGKECQVCKHGQTYEEDWKEFVVRVKNILDVQIPVKFKPRWLSKHEDRMVPDGNGGLMDWDTGCKD